jgi:hypothetical protein
MRDQGCIDYYLVTTVGNTVVSARFVYYLWWNGATKKAQKDTDGLLVT